MNRTTITRANWHEAYGVRRALLKINPATAARMTHLICGADWLAVFVRLAA